MSLEADAFTEEEQKGGNKIRKRMGLHTGRTNTGAKE
jgi:hypothetical protein